MSLILNTIPTTTSSNLHSLSSLTSLPHKLSHFPIKASHSRFSPRNLAISLQLKAGEDDTIGELEDGNGPVSTSVPPTKKRLSEQSSWEAKDSKGNDYLYRLGAEADNMNIAVGARAGVIDDLFTGNFLGRDADIVFDYRQKVTRSFEYLQGDYYIAPLFLDKVVCHIVKNFLAQYLDTKIPLILGIWGGKGQGKTFQTELIFQALGVEPVIMSAGELESEKAGSFSGLLLFDVQHVCTWFFY